MIEILCLVIVNILPAMALEADDNVPQLCSASNDYCPTGYYCSTTSHRCWPCHVCGEVDILFNNIPTKCRCDGGKDGDPFLICSAFLYPGETTRGPLIRTLDDLASDIKPEFADYFDGKYAERNPSDCPNRATTTVSVTTEVETSTSGRTTTQNDRNETTSSDLNSTSYLSTESANCGHPCRPEHGYQITSNYSERIICGCDKVTPLTGIQPCTAWRMGPDNHQSLQTGMTPDTGFILAVACAGTILLVVILLLIYRGCLYFKPDKPINERVEDQQEFEDDVASDHIGASQFDPMLQNGSVTEVEMMEELPVVVTHDTVPEFSNEILTEFTWTQMEPLLQTAFKDKNFKREFLRKWLPAASEDKHVSLNLVTERNLHEAIKQETDIFGVNTYKAVGRALQDGDLRKNFASQHNIINQLIHKLTKTDVNTLRCAIGNHKQQPEMETIA